jgi:hypothetical protein
MPLTALWIVALVVAVVSGDTIPMIDSSNFETEVTGVDEVCLLQFYASKSSHSMKFSDQWNALATSLKRVKVGQVDVDSAKGAELLEKLKVSRVKLPNLKLFKHAKSEHAVGIMDGSLDSTKLLKKRLKRELKGFKQNGDGVFTKTDEEPAINIEYDISRASHILVKTEEEVRELAIYSSV